VSDDLYIIFLNGLMFLYIIKKENTKQGFDWNSNPPPVMLARGYHPHWSKTS
jgi:hypothetical protein